MSVWSNVCGNAQQWSRVGRALATSTLIGVASCSTEPVRDQYAEWTHYAGDERATRFSELDQINRKNVRRLEVAWAIRAGDVPPAVFDPAGHRAGDRREDGASITSRRGAPCGQCHRTQMRFEGTPIMADSALYFSTPHNRVIATHPGTGRVLWTYDPGIEPTQFFAEGLTSRGVAIWRDSHNGSARCGSRIFLTTVDARLIAIDTKRGTPCTDFGNHGTISLREGISFDGNPAGPGHYSVTSPLAVIGDLVIVGSSVASGDRRDAASGKVCAYDVRTGAIRWTFDPRARRQNRLTVPVP